MHKNIPPSPLPAIVAAFLGLIITSYWYITEQELKTFVDQSEHQKIMITEQAEELDALQRYAIKAWLREHGFGVYKEVLTHRMSYTHTVHTTRYSDR